MKTSNWKQRAIISLIIAVAGLVYVLGPHHKPTRQDFTWNGVKQNLQNNIKLGLDLKGGSHLVMQVQTQEYLATLAQNNAIAIKKAVEEGGYPLKQVVGLPNASAVDANGQPDNAARAGEPRIVLELADAAKINEVRDTVEKKTDLQDWSASVSGNAITWTMGATAKRVLSEQAVEQTLRIIENRINAFGVAEPTLQRHGAAGSNQILLQMPGITDPERIKKNLIDVSKLELMHVISDASPLPVKTYATEAEAQQTIGALGTTRKVLPYVERPDPTADPNNPKPTQYVVVETPSIVDGSLLRDAQAVSRGPGGTNDSYQISFSLKPAGADKFGTWTGANINQYMGVVLDDKVKSIAYIKSQITDSGEISGNFTKQAADDLTVTLRSGALPARITFNEERTVGPSLGADSIKAGVTASVAGLLMVIAFMLFYYRGSGVNAVVALVLNMILMVAAIVLFKATLTLPGIAGIILTIGMAVDSNVLIFERIREELGLGDSPAKAIDVGFARAFVTIIDTHVTTIISSLFLFLFGTGPIRGFAVTLVIGLLINLFTAVYVSRTIFMWLLARNKNELETLSI
jgi:preprotein translocase subunit SecD